jgi:hypothetical protein
MPPRQISVMSPTILKKTLTALKLIIAKPAECRLGKQQARCASNSPPTEEDLIPYSAKDLKYLLTLWDEAQRYHQFGLRYRHVYVGAVGLILTGWFLHGLSFSALGGILMLAAPQSASGFV